MTKKFDQILEKKNLNVKISEYKIGIDKKPLRKFLNYKSECNKITNFKLWSNFQRKYIHFIFWARKMVAKKFSRSLELHGPFSWNDNEITRGVRQHNSRLLPLVPFTVWTHFYERSERCKRVTDGPFQMPPYVEDYCNWKNSCPCEPCIFSPSRISAQPGHWPA